jgi:hypothetical protein
MTLDDLVKLYQELPNATLKLYVKNKGLIKNTWNHAK